MQTALWFFYAHLRLHEAGAGNFITKIGPARRKTVQPRRMRPALPKRRRKGTQP
nr:MAG TPA: hypothetical protein [Caudoviricetes sp.]